jgi:hypothetical protein
VGIVGRVDDSGETSLAAATAAIITARWTASSGSGGRGHAGSAGHGRGGNGNGHGGDGHEYGSNGHGPVASAGYSDWAPPTSPAPTGFDAPDHGGTFAGGDAGLPPADAVRPPVVHGGSAIGSAAATFFSATHPDPVPEVFSTRIPGQRGPDPISGDVGSVMSDLKFPEPFDSGFNAFGPVARHQEPAPRPDLPERVEGRSHVPPGFERRTFGPVDPGPDSGTADFGPTDPGHYGEPPSYDEPRGFETVAPPSALGGFSPSAPSAMTPPAPPVGSLAMPASFAPPEPAPWTDTEWTEFARPDLDRDPAELVGVGAGTPLLPRRVPQTPDVPDFALFDNDPSLDPSADGLELNRIATFLRDDEDHPTNEPRPDGFDVACVLDAVRGVQDVRDAQLRWNASAGHTLRIEFVDGADVGEVTRAVVRLLREQMGLAAAPSARTPRLRGDEATLDRPLTRPRGVASARVPMRPQPAPGVTAGLPLPRPSNVDTRRLVLENVTVTRLGAEATVEVRLTLPGRGTSVGVGRGPGVDAYLSRLAATAAADAVDDALAGGGSPRGKAFVEHVAVVPFGVVEVAVVVLLLSYGGQNEQLSGSAIVGDDPQQAVVRATLAALNRRLESLLS